MKKILYILGFVLVVVSCSDKLKQGMDNPYTDGTKKMNIQVGYPEEYSHLLREGINITVTNPVSGVTYSLKTDKDGKASIELPYGFYRVASSDKGVPEAGAIPLFNKSLDEVKLIESEAGEVNIKLDYTLSFSGQLIIKEVYFSGCTGTDNVGFQYDKYVQIYNNSADVAYLDSLCFGTLDPYNAPTKFTNWSYVNADGQQVIMDTIPIVEAVWQFPGNGSDFPLQPGESTVLALNGALDHTKLRPQSVNLDVPGYFVTYNPTLFTMTSYHPAPGQNLAGHWLNVLIKTGASKAYAFSVSSPTVVLFNIRGVSAQEFVNDEANQQTKPGTSASTKYVMIPSAWVLDGVEIFQTDASFKRLPATIDASAIVFGKSEQSRGKTIHRKIDEAATAAAGGRIVYMDTNNSADDFYIRESQSIKE